MLLPRQVLTIAVIVFGPMVQISLSLLPPAGYFVVFRASSSSRNVFMYINARNQYS